MNNMAIAEPIAAVPNARRWFHLTPGKLVVLLLALEAYLLLCERWFPKGWAVLIALAAVGVFLLIMFLWLAFALLFRWLFQFSIRSLLILTVAVAIPCSWLTVEMKWAREQREAVKAIVNSCRYIAYDRGGLDSEGNPILPSCPEWLREVGTDFFGNVNEIDLSGKNVKDADLEKLNGIRQLQVLSIETTQITDVGLDHLKGLNQLKGLAIRDTPITDVGLEHLTGMEQLETLYIDNPQITDAGLEHLTGMKQLKYLYLWSTQVTAAGVTKLQQALPDCKIYH